MHTPNTDFSLIYAWLFDYEKSMTINFLKDKCLPERVSRVSEGFLIQSDMPPLYFADSSNGIFNGVNGVFTIQPIESPPFQVYCQTEPGYTWTVIQQRFDNSTSFNRNWTEYKEGFGIIGLSTNYW